MQTFNYYQKSLIMPKSLSAPVISWRLFIRAGRRARAPYSGSPMPRPAAEQSVFHECPGIKHSWRRLSPGSSRGANRRAPLARRGRPLKAGAVLHEVLLALLIGAQLGVIACEELRILRACLLRPQPVRERFLEPLQ